MFIHLVLDLDGGEVISVNEVQWEEVLTALGTTPAGAVSYVLNAFDTELLSELKHHEWEDIEQILIGAENEGMLVAKYDNDVME